MDIIEEFIEKIFCCAKNKQDAWGSTIELNIDEIWTSLDSRRNITL